MGVLLKEFPFTVAFILIVLWASTWFGLSWLSILIGLVAALFVGAGIDYMRGEGRAGL
jgi:hypothetical protein